MEVLTQEALLTVQYFYNKRADRITAAYSSDVKGIALLEEIDANDRSLDFLEVNKAEYLSEEELVIDCSFIESVGAPIRFRIPRDFIDNVILAESPELDPVESPLLVLERII